jgi:hypothetical protein
MGRRAVRVTLQGPTGTRTKKEVTRMVTIEKYDEILGPVTVDSGRDEDGFVRGLTLDEAKAEIKRLTDSDPDTYYYVMVGIGAAV